MVTLSQALAAKKKLSPLAKQKGAAISIGSSGSDYHIAIRCKAPPAPDDFPDRVDGVAIVITVIGEAKALEKNEGGLL